MPHRNRLSHIVPQASRKGWPYYTRGLRIIVYSRAIPCGWPGRRRSLSSKDMLFLTPDADLHAEEVAGLGLLRALLLAQGSPCRGDVQFVQVGAAEGATGGILDGQLDDALNLAVRVVAHNAPAAPARAPHEALTIDGEAVGDAGFVGRVNERAAIGDGAACGVKIVDIDDAAGRVGQVHARGVGTPADAVGDGQPRLHHGDGAIGIKAVEAARALTVRVALAHRPGPEAAPAVDCAIVEAIVRLAGLRVGIGDELQVWLLAPAPEGKPVLCRHHQPSACS